MTGWPTWHTATRYLRDLARAGDGPAAGAGEVGGITTEAAFGAIHRDGVPWDRAPLPRRPHLCRWQTCYRLRGGWFYRCACGAARTGRGEWIGRNSRRRLTSDAR